MNILKRFLVSLMVIVLLVSSAPMPAVAAQPWNVTGDYEITFFLDGDGSNTPYVHHAELVQTDSGVTGDGGYPATGGDTYHWNVVTGTQIADSISLTVEYDFGAPGVDMTMTGTIAPDGTVSGTWTDNLDEGTRTGNWSITDGISTPMIHTPANNAVVATSALTEIDWTDAIGANPPFEYLYEAYSDAAYTGLLYQSTWLAASEIPTLGTAPGDYYVRVMARDEGLETSEWSNGASNPYKITVTADPTPTPTGPEIPAQCADIEYNVIEGTGASEVINGTPGDDLIFARGGSDIVNGGNGNDCIVGGPGSDVLHGNNHNDVILGNDGSDSINGHNGNDMLYGQDGSDSVLGGAGNDQLFGGAESDYLNGGGNTDTATGNAGSDACTAETEVSCEA